jgi:peptidoglycan/xylan/chitin deacetylase (PgdA/CDA1 family)
MSSDLRWYAKKLARRGVSAATWLSGTLAARRLLSGAPRVRVLTYHRFGAARHDPFCVAIPEFERQMAWLAERGLAVSLAQVQAFLAGRTMLRDGSVLVTIDDGSPTLHAAALPILVRHAIPAVAFVPAGELRDEARVVARPDSDPDARVSWAELAAVARAGVTIGSHAWRHRSLGPLSVAEAREEAERSRTAIESRIGQRVTAFAYPFGTRADYNEATTAVIKATGYTCAFTSQHGSIGRGDDPYVLPRVKVEGGEGGRMFRLLIAGALDAWRVVDRTMWRAQATAR